MEWRKAALWTVGIVTLAVAAGAVALEILVDPERLKRAAAEHARATWKRELRVDHVSLRFLPMPALQAVKVTFANPAWCRQPHLLQADYVRADLELLPLLTGQVRVKRLALEGVRAGLEEGDDGQVSWQLEGAPSEGAAAVPAISEVRIRNLQVHHRAGGAHAEPWHIEEARVDADPGLRNVRITARVQRHGRALAIRARLDDLSRLGAAGATTEGEVHLQFDRTRAQLDGRFPLEKRLAGHALRARLESPSLQDLFAFFGIERRPGAPLDLRFEARQADDGRVAIDKLAAKLGALTVRGDATVQVKDGKPVVHARLRADRLDWLKTLVDAGGTLKPKRQDEEIFHADPVAWRIVTTLGAIEGRAEVAVDSLRLGNGLELANTRAQVTFGDRRLALGPFATEMLGGSARGRFEFDGAKKTVRAQLEGRDLLLERWFRQRGSKVPFSGGPMQVKADVTLSGDTYRELAASLAGPVSLRMGKGRWNSKRAGEYEELMVGVLAAKEAEEIEFECAAADLDFKRGRASGERLLGARSSVSQLLTDGYVDFREERLDLRGRVKASSGAAVGIAMFAGEVQIHGRLARPKMRMDPDGKPLAVARIGAAIASAGATLVGSALLDAADKHDPCKAVFR